MICHRIPAAYVSQTSSRIKYLIPEWAEQSAVLLAWPSPEGAFGPWFQAVNETYAAIATEIARREILIVACRNESHRTHISASLAEMPVEIDRIRYALLPYDDVWVRDTGPLAVATAGGAELLDFRFNGWGGKYPHTVDARLAQNLHATGLFGVTPIHEVDFVLEGGSIESDGAGTLLTTRHCLLNPNRNPDLNKDLIERQLRINLGAEKILWLEHGQAEGDDTDAHIDTLARFCSPDTIAYTACDRLEDSHYRELEAMARQLNAFTSIAGDSYRLVALPIPQPIYSEDGDRLPATYANFLIINAAVLVPVYGDPADAVALERLATCFPDREIIPINCVALIRQYGSLHCMTLQFPGNVGIS